MITDARINQKDQDYLRGLGLQLVVV